MCVCVCVARVRACKRCSVGPVNNHKTCPQEDREAEMTFIEGSGGRGGLTAGIALYTGILHHSL